MTSQLRYEGGITLMLVISTSYTFVIKFISMQRSSEMKAKAATRLSIHKSYKKIFVQIILQKCKTKTIPSAIEIISSNDKENIMVPFLQPHTVK